MTPTLLSPSLPTSPKVRRYWETPHGSALALALAETGRAHAGLRRRRRARTPSRRTRSKPSLPSSPATLWKCCIFPDWETLPYDLFSPHPEIVSQRVATLYRLPTARRGVLIVPVGTLMQRLAPRSYIGGTSLRWRLRPETRPCGRTAPPRSRRLPQRAAGARTGRLRRARRADRYFPDGQRPSRIASNCSTTRSTRSAASIRRRSAFGAEGRVRAPVAGARVPADRRIGEGVRATRLRERFPIDIRAAVRCIRTSKKARTPAGIEYYLPLFFAQDARRCSTTSATARCSCSPTARSTRPSTFWKQTGQRYEQRAHDVERPVLPPAELYLSPQQLRERLNRELRVDIVARGHE